MVYVHSDCQTTDWHRPGSQNSCEINCTQQSIYEANAKWKTKPTSLYRPITGSRTRLTPGKVTPCFFQTSSRLPFHLVVNIIPNSVVCIKFCHYQFSRPVVSDSATPWTAAHQASLFITNSQSLLKLMSIELVMPSNYLILCHPHLLLLSIFQMSQFFPSGGH